MTLAPIQHKMINTALLTKEEIAWLNDYHRDVFTTVGAVMKQQGR